jgi:hypothetical protein
MFGIYCIENHFEQRLIEGTKYSFSKRKNG